MTNFEAPSNKQNKILEKLEGTAYFLSRQKSWTLMRQGNKGQNGNMIKETKGKTGI